MRSGGVVLVLLLLMGAGVGAWWVVQRGGEGAGEARTVQATLSAAGALAGGDTAGFARAEGPRPFVFPDDHGPHPEYRTEWWYLTGNLRTEEGRPLGMQLTFFRNALSPTPADRDSGWNTNQLWMAHFALTDPDRGLHRTGERFARGAAGLAGGTADPFRVWLHDWEIRGIEGSAFPMRLHAVEGDAAITLEIDRGKPPVGQGVDGWSQKGPEPGNASYYLSWTRMPARGEVRMGGETHRVEGELWMDREWSTSALSEENTGWDWFSIQLADGRELMVFELRREDGLRDPHDHGSLVEVDGSARTLPGEAYTIEVLDRWASPVDGAEYPSGWRITVPAEGLDLTVTPRMRDQEMRLSIRYWEGAVVVEGTADGVPVEGVGYVELTGYAEGDRGRGGGE